MPETPARFPRKRDEAGLAGKRLIVVGTHSMSLIFDSGLWWLSSVQGGRCAME
jgi:hypothetical protein